MNRAARSQIISEKLHHFSTPSERAASGMLKEKPQISKNLLEGSMNQENHVEFFIHFVAIASPAASFTAYLPCEPQIPSKVIRKLLDEQYPGLKFYVYKLKYQDDNCYRDIESYIPFHQRIHLLINFDFTPYLWKNTTVGHFPQIGIRETLFFHSMRNILSRMIKEKGDESLKLLQKQLFSAVIDHNNEVTPDQLRSLVCPSIQPTDIGILFAHPLKDKSRDRKHMEAVDYEVDCCQILSIIQERKLSLKIAIKPATIDNLRMLNAKVLVIMCHGQWDHDKFYLEFEQPSGDVARVYQEVLKEALRSGDFSRTRLVFLASCYSMQVSHVFVDAGIPYVISIAKTYKLDEASAHIFNKSFFTNVLDKSVFESFDLAKKSILEHQEIIVDCFQHTHQKDCREKVCLSEDYGIFFEQSRNCPHCHAGSKQNGKVADKPLPGFHKNDCPFLDEFCKKVGIEPLPSLGPIAFCCCPEFGNGHDRSNLFQIESGKGFSVDEMKTEKLFPQNTKVLENPSFAKIPYKGKERIFIAERENDLFDLLRKTQLQHNILVLESAHNSGRTFFVRYLKIYLEFRDKFTNVVYYTLGDKDFYTVKRKIKKKIEKLKSSSFLATMLVILDDVDELPVVCKRDFDRFLYKSKREHPKNLWFLLVHTPLELNPLNGSSMASSENHKASSGSDGDWRQIETKVQLTKASSINLKLRSDPERRILVNVLKNFTSDEDLINEKLEVLCKNTKGTLQDVINEMKQSKNTSKDQQPAQQIKGDMTNLEIWETILTKIIDLRSLLGTEKVQKTLESLFPQEYGFIEKISNNYSGLSPEKLSEISNQPSPKEHILHKISPNQFGEIFKKVILLIKCLTIAVIRIKLQIFYVQHEFLYFMLREYNQEEKTKSAVFQISKELAKIGERNILEEKIKENLFADFVILFWGKTSSVRTLEEKEFDQEISKTINMYLSCQILCSGVLKKNSVPELNETICKLYNVAPSDSEAFAMSCVFLAITKSKKKITCLRELEKFPDYQLLLEFTVLENKNPTKFQAFPKGPVGFPDEEKYASIYEDLKKLKNFEEWQELSDRVHYKLLLFKVFAVRSTSSEKDINELIDNVKALFPSFIKQPNTFLGFMCIFLSVLIPILSKKSNPAEHHRFREKIKTIKKKNIELEHSGLEKWCSEYLARLQQISSNYLLFLSSSALIPNAGSNLYVLGYESAIVEKIKGQKSHKVDMIKLSKANLEAALKGANHCLVLTINSNANYSSNMSLVCEDGETIELKEIKEWVSVWEKPQELKRQKEENPSKKEGKSVKSQKNQPEAAPPISVLIVNSKSHSLADCFKNGPYLHLIYTDWEKAFRSGVPSASSNYSIGKNESMIFDAAFSLFCSQFFMNFFKAGTKEKINTADVFEISMKETCQMVQSGLEKLKGLTSITKNFVRNLIFIESSTKETLKTNFRSTEGGINSFQYPLEISHFYHVSLNDKLISWLQKPGGSKVMHLRSSNEKNEEKLEDIEEFLMLLKSLCLRWKVEVSKVDFSKLIEEKNMLKSLPEQKLLVVTGMEALQTTDNELDMSLSRKMKLLKKLESKFNKRVLCLSTRKWNKSKKVLLFGGGSFEFTDEITVSFKKTLALNLKTNETYKLFLSSCQSTQLSEPKSLPEEKPLTSSLGRSIDQFDEVGQSQVVFQLTKSEPLSLKVPKCRKFLFTCTKPPETFYEGPVTPLEKKSQDLKPLNLGKNDSKRISENSNENGEDDVEELDFTESDLGHSTIFKLARS